MLAIKVHKRHAENVRKYLARRELMDNNYKIDRHDEFIYFPIRLDEGWRMPKELKESGAQLAGIRLGRFEKKPEYRAELSRELGSRYADTTKSYDVVGEIAIIDVQDMHAARKLAGTIMSLNKKIKTVLSKEGPVKGRYRTRSYVFIAGRKEYSTTYRENGAVFKVDLRKAFFSPRLAFERNRIKELVKKKERVLVMFAGVGPFAIEIAKQHKDADVVAIELNKTAYRFMLENVKLNKTKNVKPVLGDVKKIAAKYSRFADRIIMPLPKDSYHFLDSVIKVARKGCIVHYYAFGERRNAFEQQVSMLKSFFESRKRKIKIIFKRQVRPYSPREIEIVVDFKIL